MAHSTASPSAVAAKRQPFFLPGFHRPTQLALEFKTIQFATAWLRRSYTDDQDPFIRASLAAEEPSHRDRRLQEVRYGNNITLLFRACYLFRAFHASGSLWAAVSRIFGLSPQATQYVADIFVDARVEYLSCHSPAGDTAGPTTEATKWVDRWASFLDERDHSPPPSDIGVFAAVDDFFMQQKAKNGDLAGILSRGTARDLQAAPRAMRKRSPSPSLSQQAPSAKRRTISTNADEAACDSPTERTPTEPLVTGSQPSSHAKEPHDTMRSTNDDKYQNDPHWRSQDEPRVGLKIRGQALRDNRDSPSHQDNHWSSADKFVALARTNIELQDRVYYLEKENSEAARAQKYSNDAIRALQARFATSEKTSAVADAHSSMNDKLIRELPELVRKLGSQAEKLRRMEKQLEVSNQTTQKMQETISELQKNEATRAHPAGDGVPMRGVQARIATTDTKTEQEGGPESQKEFSEMLVRMASLEAKSVLFNDLHKTVREIKAEMAAQKEKAAAPTLDSTNESNTQDTSTRLKATEEATERQDQTIQKAMDRVAALEKQALARNARIASLESRPETAEDISRLESRVSTLDQNQVNNLKVLDCRLVTMQKGFEQMQGDIKEHSKSLAEMGNVPLVQFIVAEMQTKIAHIEQHETDISKRLDDMEVSQDALTLQDQSSRIDELSQSVEMLKTLPLTLASTDEVEALRTEFNALSEKQTVNQDADFHASTTSMLQGLSDRVKKLDHMFCNHQAECQERFGQLLDETGNNARDDKQKDVSAVVESLCQRVSIMENGFQIMRDSICGRRR